MAPRAAPEMAEATLSEFDGVRYLHLGTPWVQGAMRLAKPNAIELDYVQRMMVWLLLREPDTLAQAHAVQLGLGAAAITRFCHRVLKMRTTAVELNPSVIAACRAWFRLPENGPKLQVIEADAGQWVADAANAGTADVLCVDLYDHEAAAPVLDDLAFYRRCRRVLAEGGAMSVNLFGRHASFERSSARIARAFGAAHVFMVQPTREGNSTVVAMRGMVLPPREVLAARAATIEAAYGLPARKWLRMIRPLPAAVLQPLANPDEHDTDQAAPNRRRP